MRIWIFLLLAVAASACSGSTVVGEVVGGTTSADATSVAAPTPTATVFSDGSGDWYVPAGAGSEPDRPVPGDRTADETLAQINAAVPPEYDLSFEWRELAVTEDHMALALVPVQWEQEDSRYEYEDDRLDFFTEYEIDTGCQGFCIAQDWQRLMNDAATSPFRTPVGQPIEIMVDQTLVEPPGRLLVVDRAEVPTGGTSIRVELVRWSASAERFLTCDASLGEPDRALWPTFADVCIALTGDWLN